MSILTKFHDNELPGVVTKPIFKSHIDNIAELMTSFQVLGACFRRKGNDMKQMYITKAIESILCRDDVTLMLRIPGSSLIFEVRGREGKFEKSMLWAAKVPTQYCLL